MDRRRTTGGYNYLWKRPDSTCSSSTPAMSGTCRDVPDRQARAVWLAQLTERGLLRPSFVPPKPIRQLRNYTRLPVDLIVERVRYSQRLKKLFEDA